MKRREFPRLLGTLLLGAAIVFGSTQTFAAPLGDILAEAAKKVKPSELKAVAARQAAAIARARLRAEADSGTQADVPAISAIGPGDPPDYYSTPNWAYSPRLRKFVDPLPGLWDPRGGGVAPAKCIPLAVPDTTTYPGSDYYEIELRQYQEKLHSDLLPTALRGYVQVNLGTNTAVCGGAGQQACTAANNTVAPAPIRYLGPLIVARKDRPVRVKFTNKLPTGEGGKLFLPVDTTVMGSGDFEIDYDPATLAPTALTDGTFSQNRATLHLHGGRTPWISDGTPHQWITPEGEATVYPKGISTRNVPDMPDPGSGSETFYWTNQQSARLMFYHDHAWGITRLNVYAGEAAGYLITDQTEQDLLAAGIIPSDQIPLVIQDKTFVDPETIKATDPTWAWGSQPWTGVADAPMTPVQGDLWWPHVYMPAQNPFNPDQSGINAMGRWHYGPWFFPATPLCFSSGGTDPQATTPFCVTHATAPNPYYDPSCDPDVVGFCQPPEIPGTPDVSWGAEAFLDTPLVNGTAYPTLTVDPKAYRFRILNASHDRFLNLQLYRTATIVSGVTVIVPGRGYTSAVIKLVGGGGRGATAEAVLDTDTLSPTYGQIRAINLVSVGSGYTSAPTVTITGNGTGAAARTTLHTAKTEVGMVAAAKTTGFPATWPSDGREGGVPDPATSGPAWIQIGTEGGFLPAPVLLPNQPVAWNLDPTMFNVGNVLSQAEGGGTIFLGPAERADVIVDFSKFAGKTLILYNDAPTAFPALDPHYDYFTGAPDRTDIGGSPAVLPGFGPNIRTIMQIVVSGSGGLAPVNAYNATTLTNLQNAFKSTGTPGGLGYTPGVFAASQEPIIVGQQAYDSTYSTAFPTTWPNWGLSRISDNELSFQTVNPDRTIGAPQTVTMGRKAIHDEMGGTFDDYGRMSAKLGLQVSFANAAITTFALQNYVDPPTETLEENDLQIWKINHNGVDTHPIHFHLFDVQVINRVGWDGFIRLPDTNELGWKDTVRVSPLEDTIVALRPVTPTQPFGLPESIRPLNPAAPLGSTEGFSQIDPLSGNNVVPTQTNELFNFGWEYVWHCHILSHEENDMMRSISFDFESALPAAPALSATQEAGPRINLTWTEGTPVGDPESPGNLGNPANEIGFQIERSDSGGPFTSLATALANAAGSADTAINASTTYEYRVRAYNAAGNSDWSNTVSLTTDGFNHAPSFNKGADQTVLENSGPHSIVGWATAVSAGPGEPSQTVNFVATNDNNALFSQQPAIDASGALTYTPAPETIGVATVTVRLHDDGGTANGGIDTSAPQTFTITVTPSSPLKVTAPSAGANWAQGSIQTVTWRGTVTTGSVRIWLYQGAVFKAVVINSTLNDGAFDWTVPATLAPGSYTLRLTWLTNVAVFAVSAPFNVVATAGPLTVTQPIAGATLEQGTVQHVVWSGIPATGNVTIKLYRGAAFLATLTGLTPNDGAYDWTVPATLAHGTYSLRVTWLSNTAIFGTSAGFTVASPTLTVTLPDGVAPLQQGVAQQVAWSGMPAAGNVAVRLYQGSVFKATVISSTPNDGSFDWIVPATLAPGSYTLRVVWLSNPAVFGSSAVFTVGPTLMTVLSPGGGETWGRGTARTVTWSSSSNVGNIKIELYKGAVRTAILAPSTGNSGSGVVVVPAATIPASDYRIKITWLQNPAVSDFSSGFITIN